MSTAKDQKKWRRSKRTMLRARAELAAPIHGRLANTSSGGSFPAVPLKASPT